jgi:hypothetical protein
MKRHTFTTIKVLGTIDNTVYVVGKYGKNEAAVYVARSNAEYEYYSSIGGWAYTIAHDTING